MTPTLAFAIIAVGGVALAVLGVGGLRASGADVRTGRRLASAREVPVGRLADSDGGVRVRASGRIRCRDPLRAAGGERLVAYHRDVEARFDRGGWRTLERIREARSFELWDHDGATTIDPARATEPLLTIPAVWRGAASELTEPHASAISRLRDRHGDATDARATTRSIAVTDRLLVVGTVDRTGPRPALAPEASGYLITNLPIDDAMRLLGGVNRRLTSRSIVLLGVGIAALLAGVVGAAASAALAA